MNFNSEATLTKALVMSIFFIEETRRKSSQVGSSSNALVERERPLEKGLGIARSRSNLETKARCNVITLRSKKNSTQTGICASWPMGRYGTPPCHAIPT